MKFVHYKSLFATVVFIGTTLFALQQLSGINSVFYFSSTVFRSVGVPPNLANICMGIANLSGGLIGASSLFFCCSTVLLYWWLMDFVLMCLLPGSIVAMLLMDKLGRKVLLSGSFLGMVSYHCDWNLEDNVEHYSLHIFTAIGLCNGTSGCWSKSSPPWFCKRISFSWWHAIVSFRILCLPLPWFYYLSSYLNLVINV